MNTHYHTFFRYSYGESATPSFNSPQNTLEAKKPETAQPVATPAPPALSAPAPAPVPPPPPPVVSPSHSKNIREGPAVTVSQTSIPGHCPMSSVHRTDSTNSSTHYHYRQHKEEPLPTAEIMAYVNPVIRYICLCQYLVGNQIYVCICSSTRSKDLY